MGRRSMPRAVGFAGLGYREITPEIAEARIDSGPIKEPREDLDTREHTGSAR